MNYGESSSALASVIKYTYNCQSEGTIMVSTKDFSNIQLDVMCLTNNRVLKVEQKFNLANRMDIPVSPSTCRKYQLTIRALSPGISYSILASADDIITLPLNK